jgi:hypothetical protein
MDMRTASRLNRVTAMFQDATTLAFDLSRETSLGELAVRIGELASPHGGLSLPVHVRLAPVFDDSHG